LLAYLAIEPATLDLYQTVTAGVNDFWDGFPFYTIPLCQKGVLEKRRMS